MVNKSLRKNDTLLDSLVLYTRLFHKPFSAESLLQGLPLGNNEADQLLFSKNSSKFFKSFLSTDRSTSSENRFVVFNALYSAVPPLK